MRKLLNVLAIVANVAIVASLITDTCHRFGATKSKKEVTSSVSDDEYDTV
jgi:hypothetical protein